jgi:hypothetical protein
MAATPLSRGDLVLYEGYLFPTELPSLSVALEFVITGSKLQIYGPSKFGQFAKIVRNDYFKIDVRTKYTMYNTF